MFDRRLIANFDWPLVLLVVTTAAIGLLNLYSSTASWNMLGQPIYLKQLYWLLLGLTIALSLTVFNYRHLEHMAIGAYLACISLLAGVLIFGKTTMGATRWIDVGLFNLQPSEIMKIVIIIALAAYFSRHESPSGYSLGELIGARPCCFYSLPLP